MLADDAGKVVRYSPEGTNMSYPVYMDANGKQYVYTGFFSQVKEEIPSGQEVDYTDPNPSGLESSSVRPIIRTSTSSDDDDDVIVPPVPEDRDDYEFDPMDDIGVTPTSYDDDDSGSLSGGGADNNPNVDGGETRTTRQGQDNNPNVDGGETRTTRQGSDNNPNVDGGETRTTRQGSDNNPNTDGGQESSSGGGADNNPNTDGGQEADPDQGDPRPRQLKNSQAASDKITKESGTIGVRQSGNTTITNPSGSQPGMFNRKILDKEKVKESAKTNRVYGKAEGGLVSRPKKKK